MDDISTVKLLAIVGLVVLVGFAIMRVTKPSRPDDAFAPRKDHGTSLREQGLQSSSDSQTRSAGPDLSNAQRREIDHLIREDRFIEAIKLIREITGLNLKAAKDFAEARRDELGG